MSNLAQIKISTSPLIGDESTTHATTWPQLVAWLEGQAAQVVPKKEDVLLITLTDAGGGVSDAAVREVWGIGLDYDGTTEAQFQTALAAAQRLGCGFAYTSYRHATYQDPKRPEATHRYRIAFPFDRPLAGAELQRWGAIWQVVANAVGVFHPTKAPGTAERNIGRRWYIPATSPGLAAAGAACWFHAWEGQPLDLDVLIEASAKVPSSAGEIVVTDEIDQSEIIGRAELHTLMQSLCRRKNDEDRELGRALKKALDGEQFALAGERNTTTFKLAGEIAKEFPHCRSESVGELLRCSLEQQGEPTVEAFVGQLKRQQAAKQSEQASKRAIREMFQIPALQPSTSNTSASAQPPRPILQLNGFYWMRRLDSWTYDRCVSQKDLKTALPEVYGGGLALTDKEGKFRAVDSILLDYAKVIDGVEGHYDAPGNLLDQSRNTLVLACAPRRAIKTAYHDDVDHWLHLLAGEDVIEERDGREVTGYGLLLEWLFGLLDLSKPSPALSLVGQSGSGKGLLAEGISRIWLSGHAKLGEILTGSGFNAQLESTPLIWADEGVPEQATTQWIRRALTESSRSINKKFQPPFVLSGHVRAVFTLNNMAALIAASRKESISSDDAEAVQNRFLVINIPRPNPDADSPAKAYLKHLEATDPGFGNRWVAGNQIAEHIIWLWTTAGRPVPKGRFAVQVPQMANGVAAAIGARRYQNFVRWILNYLYNPHTLEFRYASGSRDGWGVRIKGGRLYVLPERAGQYAKEEVDPSEWTAALTFFAVGERRSLKAPNWATPRKYRELSLDKIEDAAGEDFDVEQVLVTMKADTEDRLSIVSVA